MSSFYRYFEFASKNSLNRSQLLEVETFFKNIGLNFVFAIESVNKRFGRVASGLKYETGGGYDYKNKRATFVFCLYRGPSLEKLKEEIVLNFKKDNNTLKNIKTLDDENLDFKKNIKSLYSKRNVKALEKKDLKRNIKYLKNNKVLIKDLERKALFNWLKEKKYIHCIEYEMVTHGPRGDRVNLAFKVTGDDEDNENSKKREQLSLYELNLLLTKIFKIYLVDNAFKTSDNFKTDFFGTTTSRNFLYKKFLIKYLKDFPGRPYRLIQNPYGYDDNKPKNLLRSKIGTRTIADSTISKYGLTIVPKKIYLRKIIENKVIDNFINTLNDIEKEINHDIGIKKICLDFINDKINEKETKDKLTNSTKKFIFDKDEVIKNCLKAKNQKKEIETILSKKAKKISFNTFINKYIDFFNATTESNTINNKILKPYKSKEVMSNHQQEIENIVIISKFVKDNNIKLKKMGKNITLYKLIYRIQFVKNEALKIQEKEKKEIEQLNEKIYELKNEARKNDDALRKLESELRSIRMEIHFKENKQRNEKLDIETNKEIKQLRKKEERLQLDIIYLREKMDEEFDDVKPRIEELYDKIEEKIKKINSIDNIINICDSLIKNHSPKKTIEDYGYKSLKNMITDIYRSNLFDSRDIKRFLFENKIVRNNFEFYLFFN